MQEFKFHDFTFRTSKTCISNSVEMDTDGLQIPYPEMYFGNNYLSIEHKDDLLITFKALDALNAVEKKLGDVQVSMASQWQGKGNVINPFDWTYSTNYSGTTSQFIDSDLMIDTQKLANREEILFYDHVILYEDELGDNGVAVLSIRLVSIEFIQRVMKSSFFVLMRMFCRIDKVLFRSYDTRIYHEFGTNAVIREFLAKEVGYETILSQLPVNADGLDYAIMTDENWVVARMLSPECIKERKLEKMELKQQ